MLLPTCSETQLSHMTRPNNFHAVQIILSVIHVKYTSQLFIGLYSIYSILRLTGFFFFRVCVCVCVQILLYFFMLMLMPIGQVALALEALLLDDAFSWDSRLLHEIYEIRHGI